MMTSAPIARRIILLGAGNAHLRVMRAWRMKPEPGVQLSLVTDTLVAPYSGMLPGRISGRYSDDDMTMDVGRLCAAADVELIHARAIGVRTADRMVDLQDRPPVSYDVLSINVGSRPVIPAGDFPEEKSCSLKPFYAVAERVEAIDRRLETSRDPFPVVVAGGGAGGFEVVLALAERWRRFPQVTFEILVAGDRMLSSSPAGVARLCEKALQERGIGVRPRARVVGGDADGLHLESGEIVPYALCVWSTSARPLDLFAGSGLELDAAGFVRVDDSLRSVNCPEVFGAGDCITMDAYPDLPRAGIFSVREGPTLGHNLRSAAAGGRLRRYRPQRLYLFLLNTSDGGAVMRYGRLAGRGAWAFRWKEFIDRRWIQKFHDAYEKPMKEPGEHADGVTHG